MHLSFFFLFLFGFLPNQNMIIQNDHKKASTDMYFIWYIQIESWLVYSLFVMYVQVEELGLTRDGKVHCAHFTTDITNLIINYPVLLILTCLVYCRWKIRLWPRQIQGWRVASFQWTVSVPFLLYFETCKSSYGCSECLRLLLGSILIIISSYVWHAKPIFRGKPKKGRTASAPREAKRTRVSSEQDLDDEDDPDMNWR